MKAIACPNCSAPIALQQGVAVQKCSFCDTEVKPDFEAAPEFAGLDEKQFEKLFRRASDSEERGFIDKSDLQFRTLAALLEGEGSEREIDIQVKSYSLRLKSFLHEYYNDKNGETLLSFQREVEYAPTCDPSFSYMRIDAPMIDLIDDIEDHCEKLPEDLRLRLASQVFSSFKNMLTFYLGTSAAWIVSNCSNCYETEYGEFGDWQRREPLIVPVYMAMEILCEMHSMLIRYTEIIDLKDGRDEALLSIKDSYESLLLRGFTPPEHRQTYKIDDISDERVVQEFFSYKEKLEQKIAPILAERARIKREREEAERLERERKEEEARAERARKEEAARAERARVAAEKERKHQEWLASPEYKSMREKRKIAIAICTGVVVLITAVLAISGESGKDGSEENQSSRSSLDSQPALLDQSSILS